jgi:hypothetical protein
MAGLLIGRKYGNNQWVYNIFLLSEAGFTNLIFAAFYDKYTHNKSIIISGLIIFIILYIYEVISHGFLKYNNLTYSVMSVQFVLYSLYFFYLLLKDDHYINLKFSSEFWWIAGTLLFYFGNTASNLFDDKLYSISNGQKNDLTNFIFKALNIILYSCWSYSFICRKWLTTLDN